MIGGTSWHSTIEYYRLINTLASERIGTQGNPYLLLYSQNIELLREQNKEKIDRAYLDIALKLQTAGAQAIVICANTPHMVYDFVAPQIDIPILHIADPVGKKAQALGMQKLGLLGNKPTMTRGFMQSYLKEHFSIDLLIPEGPDIDQSHHYVSKELTQGKFTDAARDFYFKQMRALQARGAEGIILGCTELPILIEEKDIDMPLFATTQLHVERAVAFIFSPEGGPSQNEIEA